MMFDYHDPLVREHMYHGQFGLERETLRVDANGALAQTKHPFGADERISRDFCENQVELITGVAESAEQAVRELEQLHRRTVETLLSLKSGAEYLWPFSNPPRISGEEEIPVAVFSGNQTQKMTYRQYLARKYGKRKMLFCGIHCNFSFDNALLEAGFAYSGYDTFRRYKDAVYLSLAQRLTAYSWLLVYLTAAGSVSDDSLFDDAAIGRRYASPRCGEHGYWNDFVPILAYDDIEAYTESIRGYISAGSIVSPSELYYPIRLKPKGENRLDHLCMGGVNHIELRMFDVNPLTPVGIFAEDLDFVQLLILYLMAGKEGAFDETAQTVAVRNMKQAALYDDEQALVDVAADGTAAPYTAKSVRQAASDVLHHMRDFFASLDASPEIFDVLDYQQRKIDDSGCRYAVDIRRRWSEHYTEQGLRLAQDYATNMKSRA